MTKQRRTRGTPFPLIAEKYPSDYNGYQFITLLHYRDVDFLTIIDNTTPKMVNAYVLDKCSTNGIDEQLILRIAQNWYTNGCIHPISIEFAINGLTSITQKIFQSYTVDFITRIIGPLYTFNITANVSTKRRKRKIFSPSIHILPKLD